MATFSPEDNLDEVWSRVVARIQTITNWDLSASGNLNPDEIVEKISPPKQDVAGATKENAKKYFGRALHCIDTFGQIAATATAAIFGPSQQCMNAVSFIINAAQRVSAIYDDITTLMERMSVFFDKLRVYLKRSTEGAKLSQGLRARLYEVLAHFLEIMAKAHKITTSKRQRAKLAVKATIFGEDDGIRASLEKLETIIAQVTSMKVTDIASELSEAAQHVRSMDKKVDWIVHATETTNTKLGVLTGAEDRRREAENEKRDTEVISRFLRMKDTTAQPWQTAQEDLARNRVQGTGRWLTAELSRWYQPQEQTAKVVSIHGSKSSGKSYLCSVVVDRLLELHRGNPQVFVAYYYLRRDPAEPRDSVNKAIKAILWQFAQADRQICRDFRKLAVNIIKDVEDQKRKI